MEIQLRPCRPEHLGELVDLALRAWEPVFASIREHFDPELYDYYYPDWRAHQQNDVERVVKADDISVTLAWAGSQLAGFVAFRLGDDNKTGEIYMIAVDPEFQRQGISSQLTGYATRKMQEAGMEICMLSTGADPGHAPARKSYEKSGFKPWQSVIYFKRL